MGEKQAGGQRDAEIDRLLKETEVMLRHTRVFLDHLSKAEQLSRKYLEEMEGMLERELHRLHRRKGEIPPPQAMLDKQFRSRPQMNTDEHR